MTTLVNRVRKARISCFVPGGLRKTWHMLALNTSPLNEHSSHVHCGVSLSSAVCILSLVVIDCIRAHSCCSSTPPPSDSGTRLQSDDVVCLLWLKHWSLCQKPTFLLLHYMYKTLCHTIVIEQVSCFFVIRNLFGVLKESQFQHNVVFFWPFLEKNPPKRIDYILF